jgi:C4-dicarboxylate-specific signal transduction histidine kinase
MMIGDRLIGVFSVERKDAQPLDEHAEQLVGVVANQSASAIHNARQFAELQRLNATLEQRVLDRTRELEATNEELRGAQAELVHAGKMASIGQLAAGVAHELNTPIASVTSSIDTLKKAVARLEQMLEGDGAMSRLPRLGQVLKAIEDSNGVIGAGAKRVDEIVRRLRKFTRLDEAGLKKADLREGIEDAVALLREEW